MKALFLSVLCLFLLKANAQTTVWQETFDPAPLAGWNLNVSTGANATEPNFWEINDDEGGVMPPGCGTSGNGNKTLHITADLAWSIGTGATYNAGGLCGFLFCTETHTRAESPSISTLGKTNMTLTFDYIENGDGTIDNATIYYSVNGGTTWLLLNDPAKTIVCTNSQGQWTAYSIALPAACNNIANLKIGFNWENDDDGNGTDPSVAINNIKITTPSLTNTTPVAIDDTVNVACNSGYITVNPMGNDYDVDAGQTIYMDSVVYTGGYAAITNNPTYNSFNYKPLTNYSGPSYVNYLICDNGIPKKCDTGIFYYCALQ
jgi:Bacterial Ig domain